jgi:hypothetical protein
LLRPPTVGDAEDFLSQQETWLATVQMDSAGQTLALDPAGVPYVELAPRACITLSEASVRDAKAHASHAVGADGANSGDDGGSSDTMVCGIHAVRIGPVALLGIEGEPFIDYQLNIGRASPFPITLVCGYTNGCVGCVNHVPRVECAVCGMCGNVRNVWPARIPACSHIPLTVVVARIYNT